MMWKLAFVLLALLAFGCVTDNVLSSGQESTVFKGTPGVYRPSPGKKIYLTKEQIREKKGYKVLGEISVSNLREGEETKILQKIANKALEVGADAVFQTSVWWQPTATAWSAPQGFGIAVKLDENSDVDLTKYKGKWWNAYIEKSPSSEAQNIEG